MKCPSCKTDLIIDGKAKMQTLNEHISCQEVTEKDKYVCPNKNCETYEKIFWNFIGDLYSSDYSSVSKINFIDNNNAPFGSFQRKMNVEIYKKDKNKIFKLPLFNNIKIEIYYCYQSDDDGNILKRNRHFRVWKNNVQYIPGIRMLKFSIRLFHKEMKIYNDIKLPSIPRKKDEWWRKVSFLYKKIYLKYFYKKQK